MSNYIPKPSVFDPDDKGQFGIFGGQYVPETLMPIFTFMFFVCVGVACIWFYKLFIELIMLYDFIVENKTLIKSKLGIKK